MMTNRNNTALTTGIKAPELIGKHKGQCQGDVFYIHGLRWGIRRCSKCGQDGRHGDPSPDVIITPAAG